VTLARAVLILGAALVVNACAAGPTALSETPAGHVTPSAKTSPSSSPTPILPLQIMSVAFHAGEQNLGYTPVTPVAKGGVQPYTWEVTSGSLPPGLIMASTGKVTGTPNALGTYLFTVQVTDGQGSFQSINSSISVSRRVAVTGNPCVPQSPCNVEAGCLTACGEFGFLSGGIAPFKYKVTKGSLPTGMALSGFKLTKAFPAPATQAGKDWVFTVRVTDGIGAWAETTTKFHVYPHIAFTPPLGAKATCKIPPTGGGCTATLAYTLGTPNLTNPKVDVQVQSGPTLPAGYTAKADNGTLTFTVPSPYTGVVRVAVIDTSTCGPNLYCTSAPATINIG
jgi:large repetitive protein